MGIYKEWMGRAEEQLFATIWLIFIITICIISVASLPYFVIQNISPDVWGVFSLTCALVVTAPFFMVACINIMWKKYEEKQKEILTLLGKDYD